MPQHVWMDLQMLQSCRLAELADHVPNRRTVQRSAPFTDKQRVAVRIHLGPLDQPSLNRLSLAVVEFVLTTVAVLGSLHKELLGVHVDVGEFQCAQFSYPQTVPEHQEQNAIVEFG